MKNQIGKYTIGKDALIQSEYEKLVEACSSYQDEALLKFTVATGLRREDVVRIELVNIDLEKGSVVYAETKKGNRIRRIFIGKNLCQLLTKYCKTLPKDQKLLFDFCGKTAYNKLPNLCDVACIRRRPFHALRATCIKRCQKAGWTPEQVMELTGDTLQTIQAHYLTPGESEMIDIANLKEIV